MHLPNRAGGYRFRCDLRDSSPGRSVSPGSMSPRKPTAQGAAPAWRVPRAWGELGHHTLVATRLVTPSGKVVSLDPTAVLCGPHWNLAPTTSARRRLAARRVGRGRNALPGPATRSPGAIMGLATRCRGDALGRGRPLDDVLGELGSSVSVCSDGHMRARDAPCASSRQSLRGSGSIASARASPRTSWPSRGSSIDRVVTFLKGHGYQGWRVDHSQPRPGRPPTPPTWTTRLVTPFDSADDLFLAHTLWTARCWRGLSGSRRRDLLSNRAQRGVSLLTLGLTASPRPRFGLVSECSALSRTGLG